MADAEVLPMNAPSPAIDAEVDRQVATARKFPRSVQTFIRRATELATLTPAIAQSCIYALPRQESGEAKIIEGPSARFAEIVASSWGNMRAKGEVVGNDDQFVTARGTAWDVETNVAISYEVRRRITTSKGRTYSADMIAVTGNAGASIALRNAILKAVPTPFWKPIYNECRRVIAGDSKTFGTRRDNALHELAVIGVPEGRVYAALGVMGRSDLTTEHLIQLAGFITAIKDGDTTVEDAFPVTSQASAAVQPGQRKSQQQGTENAGGTQDRVDAQARSREMPSDATGTVGGPVPPAAPERPALANVGTITDVAKRASGAAVVTLSTGLRAGTADPAFIDAAERLRGSGQPVELVLQAPSGPGFAPIIVEINPLPAPDEGRA